MGSHMIAQIRGDPQSFTCYFRVYSLHWRPCECTAVAQADRPVFWNFESRNGFTLVYSAKRINTLWSLLRLSVLGSMETWVSEQWPAMWKSLNERWGDQVDLEAPKSLDIQHRRRYLKPLETTKSNGWGVWDDETEFRKKWAWCNALFIISF